MLPHSFPPLFCKGRHDRPVSGELLWCRLFIAGSLADNAKMTAIQSARKRICMEIPFGNVLPYQRSAYSLWLHTITTPFISGAAALAEHMTRRFRHNQVF
jgi:hypothetical protein